MTSGELKVLMALDKLGEYIQNGSGAYESIQGTFSQDTNTGEVTYDILYTNPSFTLMMDGLEPGKVTFSTEEETSDIRRTLLFVGPPAHPSCIFNIENTSSNPIIITLSSVNIINDVLDARGLGANGDSPISFELRFFPA